MRNGERMEPNLAKEDASPAIDWRASVGKSSPVYIYTIPNASPTISLLTIVANTTAVSLPAVESKPTENTFKVCFAL